MSTKAQLLDFSVACSNCPFAEDRGLGRDRLYCLKDEQVVKAHWTATLDCAEAIEATNSNGFVGDEDNRGSGRWKVLLQALSNKHNDWTDELDRSQFDLGLRHGVTREPKITEFTEDSPYYEGYGIGLEY